jgi:CheY-like chemotaxis protein
MSSILQSAAPKASLVLELGSHLPLVLGDSVQLQQIVLNLVVNAAEAIGPSGTIVVRTTLAPAPEGGANAGVRLEVMDDGVGMSEATRGRIFDPFFSTKSVGRGLGLAVVQGSVRAHRGTLAVDSGEAGTTFRVVLPASMNAPRPTSERPPATSAWRGHGLVLVADDEPMMRQVVGAMLEGFGFTLCYAADGVEAMEVAERAGKTLVAAVVDVTMPRMDGCKVLAALKLATPTLPVVLMSGYSTEDVGHGADQADGFLTKPFSLEDLSQAMELAMGRFADDPMAALSSAAGPGARRPPS